MKINGEKFVCLGGGIGTVNLIKGLKLFTSQITTVVSMADDGGSAGRLRRIYNVPPTGDLISCMSAMSEDSNPFLSQLLTYRFPGDRYGQDGQLAGHKLGNLILVAIRNMTGNMDKTLKEFQKLFRIPGTFLPATEEKVTLSAKTKDGKIITGEETIDLGKYQGERILDEVFIHPKDAKANKKVINAIVNADCVIAGPGDLYSNVLPVLLVPEIKEALIKTKAQKLFIINVANKPFETRGYSIQNYVSAIEKHIGSFPFHKVIANNNFSVPIPQKYDYKYVKMENSGLNNGVMFIQADLVNKEFPLYHNSSKLAKVVCENI